MKLKDQLNSLKQADLAALFKCTDRTIQRWHEQGLPRHGEGRGTTYVWAEVLPWYLTFMSGSGSGGGELKPKDRKLDADASIAEMQAAKMAGETLDAAEVRRVWEAFLARLKSNLMGYADRAAPLVEEGMGLGERVAVLRIEMNNSLRDIVAEQTRIAGEEEPRDQAS